MSNVSSFKFIAPNDGSMGIPNSSQTNQKAEDHIELGYANDFIKESDLDTSSSDIKETDRHGTILSGFSVILKSMIGSGIFGMARACSKFGIISAVLFLILAAAITWVSLRALSILALDYRRENPSFYSVSERILPRARWVLDTALIINCLGAAIVYVQTAGTLMAYAIVAIFGSHTALEQSHIAMLVQAIMVVSLTPLCMMKEITSTQIANLIGLGCLLYIFIMTFFYTPLTAASPALLYPGDGALVAFGSFPTFIFAFTCQQNMFVVANELKNATLPRLNAVGASATLTGFLVYMPMMLVPFLTFGMATKSNYLYNLVNPDGSVDVPIIIAFVLASISVSISFVLQVHPIRRSVVSLIFASQRLEGKKEKTVRMAVVSAILLIAFGLALGFGDDLSIPINVAGLLGGNTMSYVMPCSLFLAKYGLKKDMFSITILAVLVFSLALYPICLTGIIYDAIISRQ